MVLHELSAMQWNTHPVRRWTRHLSSMPCMTTSLTSSNIKGATSSEEPGLEEPSNHMVISQTHA
jgi:hypothetical protein